MQTQNVTQRHTLTQQKNSEAVKAIIARPDAILPRKQAAPLIGVSETTFWRLAEFDPSFPAKIRLSARRVGWRKSDLEDWLKSREVMA